jgi:hypothetical protein
MSKQGDCYCRAIVLMASLPLTIALSLVSEIVPVMYSHLRPRRIQMPPLQNLANCLPVHL